MLRLVIVLAYHIVCTLQQDGSGRFNDFASHRQECIKELNLNPSNFQYTQRDIIDNTHENGSSDGRCMLHCIFQKIGFLNEKDELQVEVVKRKMHFYDGELVNLDRCREIKAENKCDAALMVRRCIWAELSKQKNHRSYARLGEICMGELNLNYTLTQVIRYIAQLDQETDEVDAIDEGDVKCLLACSMRKMGYFDDEGELNVDSLKVNFREIQDINMEGCAKLKKKDVCERILAVRRCLLDEMKQKQKPS